MLGLCVWLMGTWAGPAGAQEVSEYGNPCTTVSIGQARIKAEVVSTPEMMYRGLGFRKALPQGRGMLFVMPGKEMQTFCMRAMEFPIDIIWIADGRVAGMEKNVSHLDQTRDYCSPAPVDLVLEAPAGFSEGQGIKVGDRVSW